jgi:hypothetical protein
MRSIREQAEADKQLREEGADWMKHLRGEELSVTEQNRLDSEPEEDSEALTPPKKVMPKGTPWHRKGLCWCGETHEKGQSGNPQGRKKTKRLHDALDVALDMVVPDSKLTMDLAHFRGTGITYAELMVFQNVRLAAFPGKKNKQASLAAFQHIWDRSEGPVEQRMKGTVHHTVEELTNDERTARLLQLAQKAQIPFLEAEVVEDR